MLGFPHDQEPESLTELKFLWSLASVFPKKKNGQIWGHFIFEVPKCETINTDLLF